MPTSARNGGRLEASSKMAKRTMQSSRRDNNTTSRDHVRVMNDGSSPLAEHPRNNTRLTTRKGEGVVSNDQAIIDLVEEEEGEEGGNEDEDSEGERVTETSKAQSELGKQSVFHHEIYHRLVNLMSSQGAYTHEPPDHGIDSMDITSFHPDQRDWSSTRAHRPLILTLWSEPPGSAPTYSIGYLLFNGRLILDYAGTPIRAFRHLPLTISSAVKGFRLETWSRQDVHRLKINDIIARLRTRVTLNGWEPLQRRGDLYDRASIFRQKSGLISFRPRNDPMRNAARAYIDSLRTVAQRASNRAIDRDLTIDELASLKELGRRGSVDATAARSSANPSVSTPVATSTPTVATTPSSRLTRSHHRPSPPPQSTPSTPLTPAPAQNLPDSRDNVPETCKESYILRDALEETVEHFKKLTRQNPKPTNTAESYSSQWDKLQAQFASIWKSQRPAEEVPQLFKLGKWTGGIGCWGDDWRTKVGGDERDREGKKFFEYMDATQEGTAYLGPDGTWRSVRDTWCNSHRKPWKDRRGQIDLTGEDDDEEVFEEASEGNSEPTSEEGSDYAQ